MTERVSFQRKISYMVALVALAFPIFKLSEPATAKRDGGRLSQLRTSHHLGQSNLGEVDPASETMRFLTLGLRGVAVSVLWNKANYYKKVEDWTDLTATLEQLAKLQPNFITFWKYQAWNLTYNVSVEFDDYHDRYYYVIRGINFLKEGERYNADHPQLLSDLGWFIGHKIGRSDEHVQYRRLFKNDPDFHPADRTLDERDNWLVSKGWYQKSIDAVDILHKPLLKKSPREFYSDPAKSQMNYAEAIEDEGDFAKSQRAWVKAGEEWRQFGRLPIAHTSGVLLRLGEEQQLTEQVNSLRTELDKMSPGIREKIADEKRQALTADERKLLELPHEEVPAERADARYNVEMKIAVSDMDVAERIAKDKDEDGKKEVLKLARRLQDTERDLRYTQSYKQIVNFDYWQMRCDFEKTDNAVAAHKLIYRARNAARAADELESEKLYREGFAKWRMVIDEFPKLLEEETVFGDDILQTTRRFRDVLESLGKSLDDSYPLWDALEKFDKERIFEADLARYHQAHPKDQKDNKPAAGSDVDRVN